MSQLPYVGRSVLRSEDQRLLTGQGQFVDDIRLPGVAHLVLLRGPYAHARITRIDTVRARAMPGVIGVFTGEDLRDALGTVPFMSRLRDFKVPPHYHLAVGRVRFLGEPVAALVAENLFAAHDALDTIEVEYDPLPVVSDPEQAAEKDSPVIYEEFQTNIAGRHSVISGDVLEAFREADHVVKARLVNQRLAPSPIECRAVLASHQAGENLLTLWSATQIPHLLRNYLARTLRFPDHRLRVIAPDVGGGFGAKLNVYAEEALVPWLAMRLHRPVKWVETRRENLRSTIHGRGQISRMEMALKNDGAILGLRCRTVADLGAYLQLFTASIPTSTANIATGSYRIPAYSFGLTEVFTNRMSTDAYRGAGRPEGIYLIERMMDIAAAELDMDPAELRRRNLITPRELPYTTPAGLVFESVNFPAAMRKALRAADYRGWRRKQKQQRRRKKMSAAEPIIGIGLANYVESCGPGPSSKHPPTGGWESATVRVEPSGRVTVLTGSSPHGQGEETSFAQIIADELRVRPENVAVIHGDTLAVPAGVGTFGSRGTAIGGSAVYMSAQKLKKKMTAIAAHLLDIKTSDLLWTDEGFQGRAGTAGSEEKLTMDDVVLAAYRARNLPSRMEPGLEANSYFRPSGYNFPCGTHVSIVEIDRETGEVRIVRFVAVDDCGRVINPLLVAGQLQGGIAQGIGQALYEQIVYDENGQLLTGSLMDYCVPRALQLPSYECLRAETPTKSNPLGVKGVGESGTIGAIPAVVNAVMDALAPWGVRHLDMPLTPEKIWQAMHRTAGK